MIQIDNITLHLGDRKLLDNIQATINRGDRIGLVGPNGAGKSTLLKIMMGLQEPDRGKLHKPNDARIGYLPQDGVEPDPSLTVYQEIESAFAEVLDVKDRVDELLELLDRHPADDPRHAGWLETYGELQHRLEESGFYTLRSDIEKILTGLGFDERDMNRSTTEFSGGWLMRMALAKLLLRKPDLLLLDEPTNHLDIESLQWIEQFLNQYPGAIMLVSHDESFLDTISTRTFALARGRMEDYSGNYSYYRRRYAEQRELLIQAQQNQAKELKDTEKFIERFRYKATKAKQVQSRIKQLEKVERIEVEDELAGVSFRFPTPERAGQRVLELRAVRKAYGDHVIFSALDLEIERGDKVAVVGPNGAGKSTLIRIMAGSEPLSGGARTLGYNVTPSYFAQHQAEELDPRKDLLDEMRSTGSDANETTMRSILGCFLFSGDDVFKKIKVLSGGEKSRVALAKMLITPANFLIFDEPTNHLDMQSKHILQQALIQYEGTLMIISHDRAFLDPIVNKTLEIQRDSARIFLGNISFYLDKKRWEAEAAAGTGFGAVTSKAKMGPTGGSQTAKGPKAGQTTAGPTIAGRTTGGPTIAGRTPTGPTAREKKGAGDTGSAPRSGTASDTRHTDPVLAPMDDGQQPQSLSYAERKELKRLEAERRNEISRKTAPLKKRLKEIEEAIDTLEKAKKALETSMADPSFYEDPNAVKAAALDFERIQRDLSANYAKWEELSHRIEGIEEQHSFESS